MGTGTSLRRISRAAALVAAGALGGGAAFAVASVPDGNGVIHACVQTDPASGLPATTANVRIIDSAHQSCNPAGAPATQTAVNWGVTGPPGAPGAAGPPGVPGKIVTVAAGHTLTLGGGQVVTVGGSTGGLTVVSPPVNPGGRAVASVSFGGGLNVSALSVSFGASRAGTGGGSARGNGAGKATFNPFNITRKIDKSSPLLSKYCATGKHFPKATIQMRKSGKTYLTYTLSNVLISSYQAASEGGDKIPVEHITLSYTKLSIKY